MTADVVPRSRWGLTLLGLGLLALGSGIVLIGVSRPEAQAQRLGRNLPVDAGAEDPADFSSNNSPSVARNPVDRANVAVANRLDNPNFSCALHISVDGGASWSETAIPFPEGEELPARCFAPDVAFDAEGTFYMTFVTLKGLGNVPNALWLVSSSDGGRRLSTPSLVRGPLTFQVRLLADPVEPKRLYLTWLQASGTATLALPASDNPILFARSDDGGGTFGEPVRVSDASRVVAPSLAASAGRLYVSYLDLTGDALDYSGGHEGRGGEPYPGTWKLMAARSDDGGSTWARSVVDDGLVPVERFVVFLPPTPSTVVDPAGRLHIAFQDGRLGDADVWVWTSEDGGVHFRPARRVNDTPRVDGTAQYLPKLAVAPNGRLDVIYYDRRDDSQNRANHVSLQSSHDAGVTFSRRLRVSDAGFDSRIGFGGERQLADLGSRLGLVSADRRALAVWTDTRHGTTATMKQDLQTAVVAFSPASPWRGRLVAAGILVLLIGIVSITCSRLPRSTELRSTDPELDAGGPPGGDLLTQEP